MSRSALKWHSTQALYPTWSINLGSAGRKDSERSVSFVQETTEAARGSPRGFCQPYWKTKPPESVYHVKRACTILSATVLMNIKVLAFIVCQLLLTIKVNKPTGWPANVETCGYPEYTEKILVLASISMSEFVRGTIHPVNYRIAPVYIWNINVIMSLFIV